MTSFGAKGLKEPRIYLKRERKKGPILFVSLSHGNFIRLFNEKPQINPNKCGLINFKESVDFEMLIRANLQNFAK